MGTSSANPQNELDTPLADGFSARAVPQADKGVCTIGCGLQATLVQALVLSAVGSPVLLVMAGEPTMARRPNDENSEVIPWACHSTEMSSLLML